VTGQAEKGDMTMQLDIALESKIGPDEFRDLGLLAEKYGFRAAWVQNYSRAPDAFMTAVPLALESKAIKVGVAVVSPYEMHPVKLANSILTLNEYASGRAAVVITAGGDWTGVVKAPRGNLSVTRETLEIVNASLGDGVVNYPGERFQVQAFTTGWKTSPAPLIYGGAHGPKMLRMMAGITDGLMLSDFQPEMFESIMPDVEEARATRSSSDEFRLSNFVSWHVKKDRDASFWEARRELMIRGWLHRRWVSPYLNEEDTEWVVANPMPFLKAYWARTGDFEGVPEHISDSLVEGLTCSGDERDLDRHIERLRAFESAGFTEIVLGLQDDPAESIRMIGERVLPALNR
jgi:5,10-methylenetetrahydromethanopterin reductase